MPRDEDRDDRDRRDSRRDDRRDDRRSGDRRDDRRSDRRSRERRDDRGRDNGRFEDELTESTSLLIRNVSYRVRSDEIRQIMAKYGEVRDVYIPTDYSTNRPRGFAFVEFLDPRDAK
jgi:FUS-interacting serine-arginine-rich protein 1